MLRMFSHDRYLTLCQIAWSLLDFKPDGIWRQTSLPVSIFDLLDANENYTVKRRVSHSLSRPDGPIRVWCRRRELYNGNSVMTYNSWVDGSIHFWAGICLQNKIRLVMFDNNVTADRYIREVLQPVVLPLVRRHFCMHFSDVRRYSLAWS